VIRGGGSRMSWGRPPHAVDVVLSMRPLSRILRYEPADLTVTVEAGITVADLNRELARRGQWLPIDVPSPAATVGGAIATNDSGALRHRYGAPRDQIIGIRLATADGRLAAAGGQVVKNVAGYDLGKLVAGSFGTLAAIVSATFKVAPRPAASSTLALTFADGGALAAAAGEIAASQLDPLSVEAEINLGAAAARPIRQLLVRFGGTAASNLDQVAAAARLAAPFGPATEARLLDHDDADMWRDRDARVWSGSGAILRASWMPARLGDVLVLLKGVADATDVTIDFAGRAAVGSGTLRVEGDAGAQVAAIARLRERPETLGHVVVARAALEVKKHVDVWGPAPASLGIARAIKRALDPAGVLGAGRGPI